MTQQQWEILNAWRDTFAYYGFTPSEYAKRMTTAPNFLKSEVEL